MRVIAVAALARASVQAFALLGDGVAGAGGVEALVDLGADQRGSASRPVMWSQTTWSR